MKFSTTFLRAHRLVLGLLVGGFATPAAFGQASDTLHVYENILVAQDETLTISPGTVVFFHGFYNIQVMGTLIALGEPDQPILFTASDTLGLHDTHLADGGWNGIRFIGETDMLRGNTNTYENNLKQHVSSIRPFKNNLFTDENIEEESRQKSLLTHCIFEYAKGSLVDFHNGGAITIQNTSDVEITHCTFRYNYVYRRGGAIALINSNAKVSHSHFSGNIATNNESELWTYGGAIYLNGSRSEIAWCRFEENYASGIGGALAIEYADPALHNNIVHNNNSSLGGGIGILRSQVNSVFSNNQVTGNQSMFFGGGIAFIEASATLINHTIAGNYSSYGGGLYFNENSSPVFINSIIYGNQAYGGVPNQVFIWDVFSSPDFFYNNVEGGLEAFEGGNSGESFPGTYLYNIDLPPMFDLEGDNPFVPLPQSPCVDAGHPNTEDLGVFPFDLAGMPRFSGRYVDMGAYEYQDPFAYFSVEIHTQGKGQTHPEPGVHIFREGDEISFEANPDTGWRFEKWESPAGTWNENPLVLEIHEPLVLTAVFLDATYVGDLPIQPFRVWPNPSNGQFFVCLQQEIPEKFPGMRLIDAMGRDVSDRVIWLEQSTGFSIDATALPAGYYVLIVSSQAGPVVARILFH
ncbi:MAG: right-handed parallel beta-helix repeat-containing protein [Bacteroidales bacterium]